MGLGPDKLARQPLMPGPSPARFYGGARPPGVGIEGVVDAMKPKNRRRSAASIPGVFCGAALARGWRNGFRPCEAGRSRGLKLMGRRRAVGSGMPAPADPPIARMNLMASSRVTGIEMRIL